MAKFDLTHARMDRTHCLAPGLFRSLKKGERKREKLDLVYEYGEGRRVEFSGPEPLGADDLRVLQGLVALAGPGGLALKPETKTETGRALRKRLKQRWDAAEEEALVIDTNRKTLAREIGYRNTRDGRQIIECIERLWKVSVIAEAGGKRRGFQLLAGYASEAEEKSGRVFVALNPALAHAVAGGGQHARINLCEVRALSGDAARLIHHRLSAVIDPGKMKRVELDTVCQYAWPEAASSQNTRKQRRTRAKAALAQLEALGWGVNEYACGKLEIRRTAG